jgi:hypothetical protein
MRGCRIPVCEVPEIRRQCAPAFEPQSAIRGESGELDQVAILEARRLEVGPEEKPVAYGDGQFPGLPDIEAARSARIEGNLPPGRTAQHQPPGLLPHHGGMLVVCESAHVPVKRQHVAGPVAGQPAGLRPGPLPRFDHGKTVLFGVQESGAFQLCAHLGVERLDVRPDGRDRKAGLSGPKRAQVVLGGGAKKRAAVGDLVDGAEAGEPPEGPEEVPARERPDGVAVGGILLPADFREAGDRHPGIALEAAQGVAGFDGGVLFCVADQQQPVVVGRRQTGRDRAFGGPTRVRPRPR